MDKDSKKVLEIFVRYTIIVLAGLGNLYIFYKILTPATVWTVAIILGIFSEVSVIGTTIIFSLNKIQIVPACVAGAAFYLLFLLSLSTADIKIKKRVYLVFSTLFFLFILNISRILILILFIETPYFETLHWIFWHLVSTIFVVGVWLTAVKVFKIESIPIYSDLRFFFEKTRKKDSPKKKSLRKSVKKSKNSKRSK